MKKNFYRCLIVMLIIMLLLGLAALCYSAEMIPGYIEHTVRTGDTPNKIAQKMGVNDKRYIEYMLLANKMDSGHLPLNKKILVPDPANLETAFGFLPVPKFIKEARDDKQAIYVFLDIQYFGFYEFGRLLFWGPVSTGLDLCSNKINPKNIKNCQTPKGRYRIINKFHKVWSNSNLCWMQWAIGLDKNGKYFMHYGKLTGNRASHGCVRTLRRSIIELYKRVKVGDLFVITDHSELIN